MTKKTTLLVELVVGSVGLSLNAAAEQFERLLGAQIRAAKTAEKMPDPASLSFERGIGRAPNDR